MVLAESAVLGLLGLAAGAVPELSVESVVETLHTCPVASALATSSLEAGTLAGGGVGVTVGEGTTVGDGEAEGMTVAVALAAGEPVAVGEVVTEGVGVGVGR